jgi:N-acetylneuraminic acid mutarotase
MRRIVQFVPVVATALVGFLVPPACTVAEVSQVPGTWTTAAPLPDKRTEVSMTSDGGRLYLLGGFGPGTNSASAPRAVYAYSPSIDDWTPLTQLPEGVNHAGLVYLDGKLYVIGGYRESTFEPTSRLRIYDIKTDAWREGPPLPTARGALAVAVHNGLIHAIGGTDTNNQNTGAHEVFDPATDRWTTAPELPTPRNHIAAATVGDDIVVLAGRNADTFTLTVNEIYNVATGTWRAGADVPTGRSGVAAVELDGFVYLFGGETDNPSATFDDAERYDPKNDSWAKPPLMPTARHGLAAGVLADGIHVVSGGPQAGMAFSDVHEMLKLGK